MICRDTNIFYDDKGNKLLELGQNVEFGFCSSEQITIESPCVLVKNLRIACNRIGAFTFINENNTIRNTLKIGRFCSIAPNCYIGLENHPVSCLSTSDYFYNRGKWKFSTPYADYSDYFRFCDVGLDRNKIEIGNDVWIGEHVRVVKGIKIGNGAIIGAGAVVTKDVPPYAVVGGDRLS